ncbi:MAG: Do family serine endopeptidase [Bacteroidaceae bacterium]|nr:Do family serine endopeptidase [Bacteroidaceae bacterium]
MNMTTKKYLKVSAIALVACGAVSVTTFALNAGEKEEGNFSEMFSQNEETVKQAAAITNLQPVDLTQASEIAVHAVVHIKATQLSKTKTVQEMPDIFDFFFGDGRGQQRQVQTQPRVGFGSGVIISEDGYIVTNYHVVEGADEITVKLNDEREFKGRVIGTDAASDLALVKIEGKGFPTLPIGNSDALKVGEWVIAVGNPFNLNSTVTAGIVSAKARSLTATASDGKTASLQSFIQTDAAINQGNSGGALVNAKGELVGINAMLYSPTGAYSGYGFAIPTSIMKKVVSDLKTYGSVQRAVLGIAGRSIGTDLTTDDAQAEQMKKQAEELGVKDGVYVAEVTDGGAAAAAGIKKDDVITELDGKKVKTFTDLQEILAQHRPGDKISVKYIRDKKEHSTTMTLKNSQGTTKVTKNADMDVLGAAFRPLPDELKKQLGISYGLQVTGVTGGKMKEAGITKGFIILKVNGSPVKKTEELEEIMKQASQSPEQVLFLSGMYPSGKRANFAVDLAED